MKLTQSDRNGLLRIVKIPCQRREPERTQMLPPSLQNWGFLLGVLEPLQAEPSYRALLALEGWWYVLASKTAQTIEVKEAQAKNCATC